MEKVIQARENLIRAVLRRVSSEHDEPNAHYSDELEYCDDMIDDLARQLTKALEDTW